MALLRGGLERQQWGAIYPTGRGLGAVHDHLFCVKREERWYKIIYGLFSNDKWFGLLVRGLGEKVQGWDKDAWGRDMWTDT